MPAARMHADEVATDAALVRRLLAAQLPHWAELPIEPVPSAGTDHALYRLGDEMVVRLPRRPSATAQVDKEQRWLPRLAPLLPLAIPLPLAQGEPGAGYPWRWSVYRWLAGENATRECLADLGRAATDLAQFVGALQRIDPSEGPRPGTDNFWRGAPLATLDARTRGAMEALAGSIDGDAAKAAWEAALETPAWPLAPVWTHGDLQAGNLLAVGGRLSAVIDFGCLAVGDPACDLIVAWGFFSGESREVFRATLGVDDATWARGRGWALYAALINLPYYRDTNPALVRSSRRMLDAVLGSAAGGAGEE